MARHATTDGYDKVRILAVGDAGVGKTSLLHLLCKGEVLRNPTRTIGCNVEVKLHEFGTAAGSTGKRIFIEFIDVGGSMQYDNCRDVFYNQINGVMLMHDLTNKNSAKNLTKIWKKELESQSQLAEGTADGTTRAAAGLSDSCRDEGGQALHWLTCGGAVVPCIVVGTKADLMVNENNTHHNLTGLAPSVETSAYGNPLDLGKLQLFFDQVIAHRLGTNRRSHIIGNGAGPGLRRTASSSASDTRQFRQHLHDSV